MRLSLDLNKRYTYADYLTWWDNKRRELVNGFIRMMTPAPKVRHQEVCVNLSGELRQIIKKITANVRFFLRHLTYAYPAMAKRKII
jgi:hypothetical protein